MIYLKNLKIIKNFGLKLPKIDFLIIDKYSQMGIIKIKEGQSKTNQGIKSKSHVVYGFPAVLRARYK